MCWHGLNVLAARTLNGHIINDRQSQPCPERPMPGGEGGISCVTVSTCVHQPDMTMEQDVQWRRYLPLRKHQGHSQCASLQHGS